MGRKCKVIPVEAVVRGYITGITDTSLWTHYSKGRRDFGNFTLPDGLRKNERLDQPVFTPEMAGSKYGSIGRLIVEAQQLPAHMDHQDLACRCFLRLLRFRIPRAARSVEHRPPFCALERGGCQR